MDNFVITAKGGKNPETQKKEMLTNRKKNNARELYIAYDDLDLTLERGSLGVPTHTHSPTQHNTDTHSQTVIAKIGLTQLFFVGSSLRVA